MENLVVSKKYVAFSNASVEVLSRLECSARAHITLSAHRLLSDEHGEEGDLSGS